MTVVAIWSDSSQFYSYKYSDNIYTQTDTNLPWSVVFHAEKLILLNYDEGSHDDAMLIYGIQFVLDDDKKVANI